MANIQNIRAINKPQKSYMWEVDINGLADGISNMSFYAKTVSIPQLAVEQIVINHKGSKTHHAGRDASGHTLTITFWDDEAQTIHKFFHKWLNIILDQDTGAGVDRSSYAAKMVIRLKDSTDEITTSTITLTKVFPTDMAEVSLSYDSSEPVEYSITLSFDSKTIS